MLLRGPVVDRYPYPFFDPGDQGYGSLAVRLVVLTLGFVLVVLAVSALGNVRGSAWKLDRLSGKE